MRRFEMIVVGGGHAGVEAAWAAANLLSGGAGAPPAVALVTLDPSKIGVMSCNPAIGGLAKGQLVREVDALGGLMGIAADASAIQCKVLNTSKGPAVHGPRAQCDKHEYAAVVQRMIASRPEIEVIAGSVDGVRTAGGRFVALEVRRGDGSALLLEARAAVLTTGTFMRGLMHTGDQRTEGGRVGEAAATGISGALRGLGFELGRLKTGTPPRLRRGSIEWDALGAQRGDDPPVPFSELSGVSWRGEGGAPEYLACEFPRLAQVECRQTRTTAHAHELIRANLHRAPMYTGQIESRGPRYCPSIEDKVVRFADRDSHGVFLEPESLGDDSIYCNGISTSLPRDVQEGIVRSMPGCARAEILRYGYAVEYDMVRPHQILATGMTRPVEGLFLAGQINGTSGYEEAAAQGIVAGINGARLARGEGEFVLGRDRAYIGVLMDDLVCKTPVEPYRMFTSRAEHRLLLRADNAPDRLTPLASSLGLLASTALGRAREALHRERERSLLEVGRSLDRTMDDGAPVSRRLLDPSYADAQARRAVGGVSLPRGVWETALAERRYGPYLERQRADVRRASELERRRIPDGVDYARLGALRAEAREALGRFRPRTFGQAGRLEGVTPADLTLLSVLVSRPRGAGAS